MASEGTSTGFLQSAWVDSWGRPPVQQPQPWLDRLLRRPPPPPPPMPWIRRIFARRDRVAIPFREAVHVTSARLPLLRALGVPVLIGVFFSLLSLGIGADVVGRARGWLPHRSHVVQPGESLSAIAAHYGLDGWQALYRAGDNSRRHPDPDRISSGARLDLPLRATFAPTLVLSVQAPAASRGACASLSRLASERSAWSLLCRGAQGDPLGAQGDARGA